MTYKAVTEYTVPTLNHFPCSQPCVVASCNFSKILDMSSFGILTAVPSVLLPPPHDGDSICC